jgi:CRISPR-associated protein (TIGR03985 family)
MFNNTPNIEKLESLVFGSLREEEILCQAVRRWEILASLSGGCDRLDCGFPSNRWFSCADWRSAAKLMTDKKDKLGNSIYLSWGDWKNININEWLFASSEDEEEWRQSFKKKYPVTDEKLDRLLKSCPFAVDERTIRNDFKALVEKERLRSRKKSKNNNEYQFIQDWSPSIESEPIPIEEIFPNEISTFFNSFVQPINGVQRFLIDLEYIVPLKESDRIELLQEKLKKIWSEDPVNPIKLTYRSAKRYQEEVECVVYPVCFYYLLRAPYLFAYGQTPADKTKIDWYDYRVDRIASLEELTWENSNIPIDLLERFKRKKLPTTNDIKYEMIEALGYDFYKPKQMMFVRFDRYFHANYIEGTERDLLFKKVNLRTIQSEINKADISLENQRILLANLESRSSDIYCRVPYRVDDNNVVMRLRAWGAKVEVILPWDLRERMTQDMRDVWKLYQ